jgi:hypothetical protein
LKKRELIQSEAEECSKQICFLGEFGKITES